MSELTNEPAATASDQLLAALADEFAARLRRGERPTVEEYVAKHPQLEETIRKAFSAIAMIEESRTSDPAASSERLGAMIGRYKLLERIGEGGFGVVYMAEQQYPVRRKVALKVIKPGMDSRQVLARFEAERQALAIMDHPNIARVLDAGATESARPYFVMELVKGEPITEYCDRNQLEPRQRLELFVQVCQAVQHAHQKGIIHRDLKPSNVLVSVHDTKPVVKVIDFGVAKALGRELTEQTLFTGFAQLLGTPLYMSPEQAGHSALDVDTRSDIYSLGVLLYELLTGTTPFDKDRFKQAAEDEIRRIIREEDPPRPSTRLSESKDSLASISAQRRMEPAKLTKLVRGELDWIVMKTLEKDRTRRYETANGLARDIERHLQDEPVEACPPSASYRLRKFARRNKATLVTASVIGLALLIAVGSFGWIVRDRTARQVKVAGQVDLILNEVDQLERQQKWPEALATARRAGAVVTSVDADAATARRVREQLKDLEFVDRLEQIRMGAWDWTWRDGEFDFVSARGEYAQAFRDYGVDVDTLPVEASIARLRSRPALVIALAAALDDWFYAVPKVDVPGRNRLLAVARGIDPEPMRDRVRSTWGKPNTEVADELQQLADSIDIHAHQPATLNILLRRLASADRPDAALRIKRDAQYVYRQDFWLNYLLADESKEQKDYEAAARFYTAALAIRPNAVHALNNLGGVLLKQRRLEEAIAAYGKVIEIEPQSPYAYVNIGEVLQFQRKLDDAIAAYRKAIELDPKYVSAYIELGKVLRKNGKLDDALAVFRTVGRMDLSRAWNCHEVAWLLVTDSDVTIRDPARALALAEKAVALPPHTTSPNERAVYWNTLGVARYRTGDWHGAIAALQKSRELRTDDSEWNNAFFLAMAHWQLGEKDAARRWYDTAVHWVRNKAPANSPETGRWHRESAELLGVNQKQAPDGSTAPLESELVAMRTRALMLKDQHEIDEAAKVLERAVTLAQGGLVPDHDVLCDLRIARAQVLASLGQFERAEAELMDVRAIASTLYRVGARDTLIQLYKDWAKPEKAVLVMRQRLNSAREARPQTWRVLVYQLEYAKALADLKRFPDAEAELRTAYKSAEGEQRFAVAQQFVELYIAWNQPDAAARWRQTAATMPSSARPGRATTAPHPGAKSNP